METFLFDWWWRSHQSLAREGLRIFKFCVMSWKDQREPTTKYCLGRQIDVIQKFVKMQSFGQNWWWSNGTRVEYFPMILHIAALQQSPRVPVKNERKPKKIYRKDHLHVDVQRHLMGISRQWTGMRIERQARFYLCDKISPGRWSFFRPGSEKKWLFYSWKQKPQGEWDKVAGLMMITFSESGHPVFRSTSPLCRGVLKNKGGGKLSIHFCAGEGTIETVFSTVISVNQLSIYGAVSDLGEEYKACHVRTGRLVMAGQSDPLFVPTSSLMTTPIPSTDHPAQKDLLQKYQERVDKLSQQNRVVKFCTDAGFLTTVDVGQYFMTKKHWRILIICRVSDMSWVFVSTRRQINWPERLDSREHQNWARLGSHNQLPAW